MKKNAMLKIAAILMVAVLLTTCAISSTFAKYVVSDTGSAEARVAKWGVTVDVDADDAFLSTYGSNLVVAGEPVMAPGTSVDNAIVVTASGTPEVKTEVVFNDGTENSKNFITFTGWQIDDVKTVADDDTTEYCPVVFVVNGTKYCLDDAGLTAGTGVEVFSTISGDDGLQARLNEVIGDVFATEYAAGADFTRSLTIGWYWNFTVDNDYDTALGNAVATDEDAAKVNFNMNITIAQAGPANPNK